MFGFGSKADIALMSYICHSHRYFHLPSHVLKQVSNAAENRVEPLDQDHDVAQSDASRGAKQHEDERNGTELITDELPVQSCMYSICC
jgi:hypothetical protein